jgi:hypothetical protein
MGTHFRAVTIGMVAVSLAVLTGCSNVQKSSPQLSQQQQIAQSKKTAAEKAKEIADLQKQKAAETKRTADAKNRVAVLLAQSDAAFRTAQGYKNMLAKEKNPVKKQQLKGYVSKAQQVADDLAKQEMAMNATIYDSAAKIREIDSKISALNVEKKRAEQQIAMSSSE